MNKWRIFSIIFIFLTFGAIQETFRIFTSSDTDIAQNRSGLMPMSVILTLLFLFLAIRFWSKSSKNKI